MRAAIWQSPSNLGGPAERLQALSVRLQDAGPLDLLLCPELFQCSYNAGDQIADRAEPLDGPFAHGVATLARQHGIAIAYGFPEKADGLPYNSAVCFGPDGSLLGHRRKCVLPPGPEQDLFQPGSGGATVFRLGDATLGLVICYEIEFPEIARAAAQAGADILLAPTAISVNWPIVPEKVIPTRAWENGLFLLYANHSGVENGLHYVGQSCICAPYGEVLARAGDGPELIAAELDLHRVGIARQRLPFLADAAALQG